jgi:hypothetical protein
MSLKDPYAGDAPRARVRQSPEAGQPRARLTLAVDPRAIIRAERGCCCTARPSVIAIMPPTAGRPHQTDLLLCWHHYRASRHTLAEARATALGADGTVIPDVDWLNSA